MHIKQIDMSNLNGVVQISEQHRQTLNRLTTSQLQGAPNTSPRLLLNLFIKSEQWIFIKKFEASSKFPVNLLRQNIVIRIQ